MSTKSKKRRVRQRRVYRREVAPARAITPIEVVLPLTRPLAVKMTTVVLSIFSLLLALAGLMVGSAQRGPICDHGTCIPRPTLAALACAVALLLAVAAFMVWRGKRTARMMIMGATVVWTFTMVPTLGAYPLGVVWLGAVAVPAILLMLPSSRPWFVNNKE
jgi:hypothetical protein